MREISPHRAMRVGASPDEAQGTPARAGALHARVLPLGLVMGELLRICSKMSL
jgi:hypothetical protein